MGAGALGSPEGTERRQHDADDELHRVLRHPRERGPDGDPRRATTTTAATAATAASGRLWLVAAEGQRDEHDLETLEHHALERQGERVPVGDHAPPLGRRLTGRPPPRRVDQRLVVQGLVAAGPQDRLAQPLQAEDQQQAADDQPQARRGTADRAGPSAGDDHGERRPVRPPTPMSADRQSRAVPAASTIVVASTASTAQARKTARNNAVLLNRPFVDVRSTVTQSSAPSATQSAVRQLARGRPASRGRAAERQDARRDPLLQGDLGTGTDDARHGEDPLQDVLEMGVVVGHRAADHVGLAGGRERLQHLGDRAQPLDHRVELALGEVQVDVGADARSPAPTAAGSAHRSR